MIEVILNANAVVVGETDRLVVTIPTGSVPPPTEDGMDFVQELMDEFHRIGLTGRVLVLFADDVEMAKVTP